MQEMNIGEAAALGGVSAKMIRHYEAVGLIGRAKRTTAGYRVYNENDVHTLRFIKQARNLGFSIERIGELLDLWLNQHRASRKVKELATLHIREVEERIRELRAIKTTLAHLVRHCNGDDRPECTILLGLMRDISVEPRTKRGLTGRKRPRR